MHGKRPNILLIMADQLAAPALPIYGHPLVQTPHLQRLAAGGVVFENAYCPSPLCAPSRAAMLTGRLPSRTGVYDNAAELAASVPTFLHHLRQHGYRTCLSGKMHFVGPDQLHGFEERLTTDIYPADLDWTPDWTRPEHRPSWCHSMLSVVQAGPCVRSLSLDYDDEVAFRAARWLYDLARDPAPFCLVASFTQPHDPYTITRDYWDRYDGAAIDLPKVPPIPVDQLDPHSQRLHHVSALGDYQQNEDRVRAARRAYYGMVSYIDDKIGDLLRVLAATGLADDTIVLLTSDHGDFLGERGLWYKMSFFEWSVRVPWIAYAPGPFSPGRISEPVSLLDLFPTLLDLALDGLPELAEPIDGRSRRTQLEGGPANPVAVVGEYLGEGAIAPCFMLRRGQHKYIHSAPDPDQLYDLDTDPDELDNLASKPEHRAILDRFRAETKQRWDAEQIHAEVLASQRRRHLVATALSTGRRTSWDHQPPNDAAESYVRTHLPLDDIERRARLPPAEPPRDQ